MSEVDEGLEMLEAGLPTRQGKPDLSGVHFDALIEEVARRNSPANGSWPKVIELQLSSSKDDRHGDAGEIGLREEAKHYNDFIYKVLEAYAIAEVSEDGTTVITAFRLDKKWYDLSHEERAG